VAVGTPGRLVALAQAGTLSCESVTQLVLDEADALLGEGFYGDVTWLYDQLPRRKQVR
jgi:superfamily II DNA/RNA helicase